MPVVALLLFDVLKLLAVLSKGDSITNPLYSMITAADRVDNCVIVIAVDAPASEVVYQISVVVLLVEFPVDDIARTQVAPFCVMLVTVLVALLRVEITAINVFPLMGADAIVTPKVVATLLPLFPVLVCRRVCAPIKHVIRIKLTDR